MTRSLGNVALVDNSLTAVVAGQRKTVRLQSKKVELLRFLIDRSGTVVGRSDLLDGVWPKQYPVGNTRTLDVHVAVIRRALAQIGAKVEIFTKKGVGYGIREIPS